MTTARSARGDLVDFDLLRIKSTMAAVPITDNVNKRERFINKKRRRGLKRKVDELAQAKRLEETNFDAVMVTQEASAVVPPVVNRKVGK